MNEVRHLRRLERIYVANPLYFVTVCSYRRKSIFDDKRAVSVLHDEWKQALERHGWLIGRYVVMPDHVHFFCAESPASNAKSLSEFMKCWKEWTSKGVSGALGISSPVWQREFFDHLLRSDESYAEKWSYVRDNPVRAGFVKTWDKWPYQGFVHFDSPLGF